MAQERQALVVYHSACSMQHGQRIIHQPLDLLRNAGFEVLEVPDGFMCCGSAGVYNLLQPKIAGELKQRKVASIRSVGADVAAKRQYRLHDTAFGFDWDTFRAYG